MTAIAFNLDIAQRKCKDYGCKSYSNFNEVNVALANSNKFIARNIFNFYDNYSVIHTKKNKHVGLNLNLYLNTILLNN